jgi:acyl-CoA synthetase (NDP forming)
MTTQGLTVPRSVAIVGASDGSSYYGTRLMANVTAVAPEFPVYPVNPRRAGSTIAGRTVYGALADLPEVPDLVVITTPIPTVLGTLAEAGRLGVATCVIIGQHTGSRAEQRAFDTSVAEQAERWKMRVIGPNSMGVLNGNARLSATFSTGASEETLHPGNVGVLAQSGALIAYCLQHFAHRQVGYSWLVSTGNEAATALEDLLEELIDDDATQVIVLFLEGVGNGTRFRQALLRAHRHGKPVVALKVGLSDSGREAVLSHTGRMTGAREVFDTVARECGLLVCATYGELFDAVQALSQNAGRPPVTGRRAAVVTTSGGAGTYTADRLEEAGWTLPPLPPAVAAAIEEATGQHVGNPVDITGGFAHPDWLGRVVAELGREDVVDAVFVATGAGMAPAADMATGIAGAAKSGPEVYVGWVGLPEAARDIFDQGAVPAYDDPARAVTAATARKVAPLRTTDPVHVPPVAGETRWHVGAQAFAVLTCRRVSTTPTVAVDPGDQAAALSAAESVGWPVVVKLDSERLSHKSDAGGVAVGLRDSGQLAAAVDRLTALAKEVDPERGMLLVQRMARGHEILVGVTRDPVFGPVLTLGSGGVTAELSDDAVRIVLPAGPDELSDLIDRHRTLPALLAGYRGAPPADRAALVGLLSAVSDWVCGAGVAELDLNPVFVGPDGAWAADVRYRA